MTSQNLRKELKKLAAEYGADETVQELQAITSRPRGNPKIPDWDDLVEVLNADALDLLEGRDPKTRESDVSISKRLAKANPRHDEASSQKRIRLKLKENRIVYAEFYAGLKSKYAAPYQRHFSILGKLAEGNKATALWKARLDKSQKLFAEYVRAFGDPPESMTMVEITAKVKALKNTKVSGFGLWGNTSVK
jgi:hypothetical protein